MIEQNKKSVHSDLQRLLRTVLPVCIILFTFLVGVTFYNHPSISFTILYFIGAILCLICYIFVLKSDSYNLHIITYYLIAFYIFCFFSFIGAIMRPNATGTSIVVLLALLPLLIPDKFLRVNGFLLIFYISYAVLCFHVKPFLVALDDVINVTCFTLIGFLLGNNYRHIKLIGFDLQRESLENEHIDFLTGLPNRRLMFLRISNSEKKNSPLPITGVIMMDIDHFKLYNDNKGHLKGDLCLKEISKLFLKISLEKNIEIYRYGGEEFICFYYGHDEETLDNIANFILNEVRNLNIEFNESITKKVTISLGYTYNSPSELNGTSYLIDIADKALYLAKNSGRNTVKKI
ncbi:MAG: GGDEF domain-containing protein [Spirochaetia bacterium]|nr:GGDEF domain-containing protein [Spirochaetia bacterium]